MAISQNNKQALKNPWPLALLLLFVLFLLVNSFFIYTSFKMGPNLVVDDFYQRGQQYLHKQAEQKKYQSAWTGKILFPIDMQVNQMHTVDFIVQGKSGLNLKLDSVIIYAYRPSDRNADFMRVMKKIQPGIYQASMVFNLPGRWEVIVEAKKGDDKATFLQIIDIDN